MSSNLPRLPVLKWLDAVSELDIAPVTKALMLAIAYLMKSGYLGSVFPSRETLARLAGIHPRSVSNHLKKAAEAGLITVTPRHNHLGHRIGNEYMPAFPAGYQNPSASTGRHGQVSANLLSVPGAQRNKSLSAPDSSLSARTRLQDTEPCEYPSTLSAPPSSLSARDASYKIIEEWSINERG